MEAKQATEQEKAETVEDLYPKFFEAYKVFEAASEVIDHLNDTRVKFVQQWNERFAPAQQDFLQKQETVDALKKRIDELIGG
jgi:hypothetical protein